MPDAIAWVDAVDPRRAVGICGAKMGRLAELRQAGVTMPKGFTVTVDAYRWHCQQAGLDDAIDSVLGALNPGAGSGEIESAARAAQAELTGREMTPGLASMIADARPIPLEAPVMITCLPARGPAGSSRRARSGSRCSAQ